jgi:hypothetical protein
MLQAVRSLAPRDEGSRPRFQSRYQRPAIPTIEYQGTDYRLIVDRHGGVQIIRRADRAMIYLQAAADAADLVERVKLCADPETVIEVDMIGNDYDQLLWVGERA